MPTIVFTNRTGIPVAIYETTEEALEEIELLLDNRYLNTGKPKQSQTFRLGEPSPKYKHGYRIEEVI